MGALGAALFALRPIARRAAAGRRGAGAAA